MDCATLLAVGKFTEQRRRGSTAIPWLTVSLADLGALGRVDAVKPDALSRDLKRVAVDDTRLAVDVGEGVDGP